MQMHRCVGSFEPWLHAHKNFQQCGILTSVDLPVQPPVKLRNSK